MTGLRSHRHQLSFKMRILMKNGLTFVRELCESGRKSEQEKKISMTESATASVHRGRYVQLSPQLQFQSVKHTWSIFLFLLERGRVDLRRCLPVKYLGPQRPCRNLSPAPLAIGSPLHPPHSWLGFCACVAKVGFVLPVHFGKQVGNP